MTSPGKSESLLDSVHIIKIDPIHAGVLTTAHMMMAFGSWNEMQLRVHIKLISLLVYGQHNAKWCTYCWS